MSIPRRKSFETIKAHLRKLRIPPNVIETHILALQKAQAKRHLSIEQRLARQEKRKNYDTWEKVLREYREAEVE
jgi:hypothetical protein